MKMYGYPQIFKEIFKNFPTLALKTISINEVMRETAKVSANYLKSYTPEELTTSFQKLRPQPDTQPETTGEDVLEIYFCQFKNPQGVFLDLRPNLFNNNQYAPNHFWFKFSEEFRLSITKLYRGFYEDDLESFYQALKELGMIKGLKQGDKEQLKDLFFSHFGDTEKIEFSLETFNQSFLEIFKFFMKHKIKLPIDFLFLGVYLTTLYIHMEQFKGITFNVKSVFQRQFHVS